MVSPPSNASRVCGWLAAALVATRPVRRRGRPTRPRPPRRAGRPGCRAGRARRRPVAAVGASASSARATSRPTPRVKAVTATREMPPASRSTVDVLGGEGGAGRAATVRGRRSPAYGDPDRRVPRRRAAGRPPSGRRRCVTSVPPTRQQDVTRRRMPGPLGRRPGLHAADLDRAAAAAAAGRAAQPQADARVAALEGGLERRELRPAVVGGPAVAEGPQHPLDGRPLERVAVDRPGGLVDDAVGGLVDDARAAASAPGRR